MTSVLSTLYVLSHLLQILIHPSISALFCARNSLSHFNGFSGLRIISLVSTDFTTSAHSVVARCFMASSKCGVTFWFRYTLVGLPCGVAWVGACCGPLLGWGELRVGVGAATGVGGAGCSVG
jgi:hypothetical protein